MATLCKSPTLKDQFGPGGTRPPFENRTYYFDRNGEMFSYILQYLRTGIISFPETFSETDRQLLIEEVQYYNLYDLARKLYNGGGSREIVVIEVLTPQIGFQKDPSRVDIIITANTCTAWSALTEATTTEAFMVQKSVKDLEQELSTTRYYDVASDSLLEFFRDNARYKKDETIFSTTSDLLEKTMTSFLLRSGFTPSPKLKVEENVTRKETIYKQARIMTFQRVKPVH